MIGRKLPFAERCLEITDPEELKRVTRAALYELMGTDGWQVVLQLMRDTQSNALEAISHGQTPEFNAGAISAVEQIRGRLRELMESDELVDAYDEGLTND
jgi:hypothetical protein